MNGWPIVGWATLAVAAIVAVILAVIGTDEAGLRMAIRATARTSVVFFSLAFAASALRRRWPSAATAWLLRNRRQLGVSFAASHAIHLLAILALCGWTWSGLVARTPTATLVGGGIAYVFIVLMTATSFDTTAAWLGPRRWRRLHAIGAWYNWAIFALNFVVLAFTSPVYWPFAALLAGALAARIAARHAPAMAAPPRSLRPAQLAR
jgi:DMSO/TMAO reductase YedYZ heme-binding membrane subunit